MSLIDHKRAVISISKGLLLVFMLSSITEVSARVPDSIKSVAPKIRLTHAIDDQDRVTLHGNRHPALNTSIDQGPVNAELVLQNMILVLQPSASQQAELDAFTQAQQTPGSPEYHHWLTPEEFGNHFGVAAQDITTIKNYLTSHGFSVTDQLSGAHTIVFSGTAAQVKQAFHTEIHNYLWQGENHIANSSEPQIPAALSSVVSGIVNLHDFQSKSRKPSTTPSTPGSSLTPNILPDANTDLIAPYLNLTSTSHYLTPSDFAAIYDINPLYAANINGSGVTIAVLGKTDVLLGDISKFQTVNQPPFTTVNLPIVVQANGDPGYVSSDQTESTLDLEWAGAIAPQATVKFVTSPGGPLTVNHFTVQGDGITYSALYTVTNNLADVISLSYGACEQSMGSTYLNYYNNLWQQAAAQGTTVVVSSGDSGAAGCDASSNSTASNGLGINGLCSSPYSTCVGGTEFNEGSNTSYWLSNNPAQTPYTTATGYIPEVVWNESGTVLYASGGGKSQFWSKPNWQVAGGVPADGVRDVPDVSMTAALHDSYQIWITVNGVVTQQFIGGTSAATPAFAGILALAVQYNGGRLGNINPTLYGLSQLQSNGSYGYFHPTLSGNNSVPGQIGYTATGTAYNLATGLGSVDANILIRHWRDYGNTNNKTLRAAISNISSSLLNPSNTNISISSSAASITAGQALTLTANVSGDVPSGSVQFLANGVALDHTATLSGGVASLTTAALTSSGTNLITAHYLGDNNNLPSSTVSALSEFVLAAPSISIAVSAPTISAGQSLTITATVSGASPSGSIQFYLNGAALDSPVSLVGGVAALTTNHINITGNDTLSAVYSGDANNAGASSAGLTETVTAALPTPAPLLSAWMELVLALLLAAMLVRHRKFSP